MQNLDRLNRLKRWLHASNVRGAHYDNQEREVTEAEVTQLREQIARLQARS